MIAVEHTFTPRIKSGKKTCITLIGLRRKYEIGDNVLDDGEELIPVTITGIAYTALSHLTEDDAQQSGFNNVNELKSYLFDMSPYLIDESIVTLIYFEVRKYANN